MRITREILESYLACKYKGHMKLVGKHGDASESEAFEAELRDEIRTTAKSRLTAHLSIDAIPSGITVTRSILKDAPPLILNGTIEADDMFFCCDALKRTTGPSRLGEFHYVPVLVDEAERPGPAHKMLMEVAGLAIGSLQGTSPAWGILLYGRDCKRRRFKLDRNGTKAHRLLRSVREMEVLGTTPRLLLNKHCPVCEFRQLCRTEAEVRDDLTLLQSLGEAEIKKYEQRGIFTVTQLSYTFRARKRIKRSNSSRPARSHPLQALAVREKKIYVLGTPELPDAATRIYFDLEGDPERAFVYLLGMIVESGEGEARYSFWADSPRDEARLFQQCVDVVSRYENPCLYSYGSYEPAFIRKMAQKTGQHELGRQLLSRLVNVLSTIYSHVYFPTYSNSLKDIAGLLGFRWTEPFASGQLSVTWRRKWERTASESLKEMLVQYNHDDCAALQTVTKLLYGICRGRAPLDDTNAACSEKYAVTQVEDLKPSFDRPGYGNPNFTLPDFEFVNKRSYFDYQRERVFIRTEKALRRRRARRSAGSKWRKIRANSRVEITAGACPKCGTNDLRRIADGRLSRMFFDIRFTAGGIRRWTTKVATQRHRCTECGTAFIPREYGRLSAHGHSLKSWAMYKHVAHQISLANIADEIRECFGIFVNMPDVYEFKMAHACYYEQTYMNLQEKLLGGTLLHADETEVHLRPSGKSYVWVFTNLEEVVFIHKPSREGGFLQEMVQDFRGVLVSDFYSAYDSVACEQQKCLIHLIRDFNQDLQRNPWDEELKALASAFGSLLRLITATIDRYGLKRRHLHKHTRDVDAFFRRFIALDCRSSTAEGYQKRLIKYRDKLFTFLRHDGVPWNNNNAEHAVKRFAYYRERADGLLTEGGLNAYLVLLSICVTCKYKGTSFLRFLLSRETDIDTFCKRERLRRPHPPFELQPHGHTSTRRKGERRVQ